MTGQPLPCPPLSTIDEFINVSLACLLPTRPSAAMKMNSPAVKWWPGKIMEEGKNGWVLTIPQCHIYFILKGRFEVTLQSIPTDISQLDILWHFQLNIADIPAQELKACLKGTLALKPSLPHPSSHSVFLSSCTHTTSLVVSIQSFTCIANDGRWCYDLGRLPEHFQRQGYPKSAPKKAHFIACLAPLLYAQMGFLKFLCEVTNVHLNFSHVPFWPPWHHCFCFFQLCILVMKTALCDVKLGVANSLKTNAAKAQRFLIGLGSNRSFKRL